MFQIKEKFQKYCPRNDKLLTLFLLMLLTNLLVMGIMQFSSNSIIFKNSYKNKNISQSISSVSLEKNLDIFLEGCNCTKEIQLPIRPLAAPNASSCNKDTWKYGEGQKVISYSLFGSDPEGYYTAALKHILKSARKLYPGWLIRIYSDNDLNSFTKMCPLLCNASEILWCDVRNIEEIGDISTTNPRVWRFLPIGDPLVEIFISRDFDSALLPRERTAVDEWLSSNKTFHTMRDHRSHQASFLAGMWGAKRDKLDPKEAQDLLVYFIKKGKRSSSKGTDQVLLDEALYNIKYQNQTLAHDDFHCKRFNKTECRPIPTQYERTDFNFIATFLPINITQEDYIVPKYLQID